MKRLFIVLMTVALVAASALAKGDDEVIVTRQLLQGHRDALPEKTIMVEMKRLTPSKKADPGLIDAINQLMDTIAHEDYQNRTFALLINPKPDGSIALAAHSDDIVTVGRENSSILFGDLQHDRYHFVVLVSKTNQDLLEQTFKRQGKVKFIQEFEFVQFPTPYYPTNVIVNWSQQSGLRWLTVVINEDLEAERDAMERPEMSKD